MLLLYFTFLHPSCEDPRAHFVSFCDLFLYLCKLVTSLDDVRVKRNLTSCYSLFIIWPVLFSAILLSTKRKVRVCKNNKLSYVMFTWFHRKHGAEIHCELKKNHFLTIANFSTDNVSVVQSCPTLCNPMTCNPPGSSVRGILQAGMGIFLTWGLNLHCRQILYCLSYQGNWAALLATFYFCQLIDSFVYLVNLIF